MCGVRCVLVMDCCLLLLCVICCVLFVCCLLFGAWCLSTVVGVRRLSWVACYLLFVVCSMVRDDVLCVGVECLLLVVRSLLVVL